MQFVGRSAASKVIGVNRVAGVTTYLRGKAKYQTAQYRESLIQNIYPNVDTRVYYDGANARYDLVVRPGGNPAAIAFKMAGAESIQARGAKLVVGTQLGDVPISGLYAYQQIGSSKRQIPASFSVLNGTVRFRLGAYDRRRPLVIDPVVYSTLLGGAGSFDDIFGVATDRNGFAYVTGSATAASYPTTLGSYQEERRGTDAFITKVNQSGTGVVYSTRLGGGGFEVGSAIAVDAFGNAYVGGTTTSSDFPTTASGAQTTFPGGTSGFIFVLNAQGNAARYGTYVGGGSRDYTVVNNPGDTASSRTATITADVVISGIGLDPGTTGSATPSQGVYFTGQANYGLPTTLSTNDNPSAVPSANLPSDFFQPILTENQFAALQNSLGDLFVGSLKPNSNGHFGYVSYAGGAGRDTAGTGIGVTADGTAYFAGTTRATTLNPTLNGYDTSLQTGTQFTDGVLYGFSSTGTRTYGTSVGGNASETVGAVAVDLSGNVYVTGLTNSFNFLTTSGAFDTNYNLGTEMFLRKFTPIPQPGQGLVYSTFLNTAGGSGNTSTPFTFIGYSPNAMTIDPNGNAYIVGTAPNATFPVLNSDNPYGGPTDNPPYQGDAFLLVINASGAGELKGSYYGGDRADEAFSIAIDSTLNVFIAGYTRSGVNDAQGAARTPFPTTDGAFKAAQAYDGPSPATAPDDVILDEGFIVRTTVLQPIVVSSFAITPSEALGGSSFTGTITLTAPAPSGGLDITLTSSNPSALNPPGTVTIPAGQTTVTFAIPSSRASLTASVGVTVIAKLLEAQTPASVTVDPYLLSLAAQSTALDAGYGTTGTITLYQPAPTGGLVVNLSSSNGVVTVPSSVTVAAGATTATFPISTIRTTTSASATVTATTAGELSSPSVTISVNAFLAPVASSLSITPTTTVGGSSPQPIATVTLSRPALPEGAVVRLTSSNPAAAFATGATNGSFDLTFAAGEQTKSVPITTLGTLTSTAVTFTASVVGSSQTPITATLTVDPAAVLSVDVDKTVVRGGYPNSSVNVTINFSGPAAGGTIVLSSSDARALKLPTSFPVPVGATSVTIPSVLTDFVSRNILVTITATYAGSSGTAMVTITR